MIKKLFLIMIMAALIMPMVLADENSSAVNDSALNSSVTNASETNASAADIPAADPQVEIRIARLSYMAFAKQVEMAAVIGYVDEILGNSSKLSAILDEFKNLSAAISDLSASEIDAVVSDLKSLIDDFKTEARKQIDSNSGKLIDAAARMQNATSENADKINELEDNYYALKQEVALAILDKRVESSQKVIDKLNESGLDVSEMQEKLDAISSLKSELEAALEDRNASSLASINAQILNISVELKDLVVSAQEDAAEKAKLGHWMSVLSRVAKNVKTTNSELNDSEMNTSSLEDERSIIKDKLSAAEDALANNNATEAKAALKDIKANMENTLASYKEIASKKKGVSKVMKGKLASLNSALDKVVKALESEL